MTDHQFSETINWDDYWSGATEEDKTEIDASPSVAYTRDPLLEFLTERGPPSAYTDVGCGPGDIVFAVADQYPEAPVVGYDAADPILEENRERARRENLSNVNFDRAVLPRFDPGRSFDVVSCFFTLCYVAEIEEALQNLYEAVAPGGELIFTYHNRYARAFYDRIADAPSEHLDDSFPSDPDRFRERFRLVLEGESLLSYERIHDILGTWPQSVWSVVGSSERYGAWRSIPFVYVPK